MRPTKCLAQDKGGLVRTLPQSSHFSRAAAGDGIQQHSTEAGKRVSMMNNAVIIQECQDELARGGVTRLVGGALSQRMPSLAVAWQLATIFAHCRTIRRVGQQGMSVWAFIRMQRSRQSQRFCASCCPQPRWRSALSATTAMHYL